MTVGFVVTPDEIKDRVAALDASIAVLDGDVRASSVGRLWRGEWEAFVRRWTLERDSYASWGSRLFATRVMPRLESFTANYKWWARDFQRKTGITPHVPPPAKPEGLIPSEVWWILALGVGVGVAVYVHAQTRGRR